MISLILLILFMVLLFKATGFLFHIAGKVLGWVLGAAGWLILAGLAVTVLGVTLFALPFILIIGLIVLIVAAVS